MKRRLFCVLMLICSLGVVRPMVSVAGDNTANGTASTPPPGIALTNEQLRQYGARSAAELCTNPTRSVDDTTYLTYYNPKLCGGYRGVGGLLNAGAYGYTHPNTTYCNAFNGLKVGAPALAFGPSIGNKNIFQSILLFLGLASAGCNNAPVAEVTPPPSPTPSPASLIIGPDHVDFAVISAGATPTPLPIAVSEIGYNDQFAAISTDPAVVSVDSLSATPDSKIHAAVFTLLATLRGGAATVHIYDKQGHTRDISVTVVTPTPSPTPPSKTL